MDRFALVLSSSAVRDLDRLDEKISGKILEKACALENNPFPRGKLVKKIKGKKSVFYRMRAGKYRVYYFLDELNVVVLRILDKKDADKFIKTLNR